MALIPRAMEFFARQRVVNPGELERARERLPAQLAYPEFLPGGGTGFCARAPDHEELRS
jgi:hypothetical protein